MGRIPDEIIQQVRDRVDLVELVGRSVSLKRAGRSYKGLCPFHGEKTPSFHVNPDRGTYYCFGCQEGGDAFAFLMKVENLTLRRGGAQPRARLRHRDPRDGRRRGRRLRGGVRGERDRPGGLPRARSASPATRRAAYLARRGLDARGRRAVRDRLRARPLGHGGARARGARRAGVGRREGGPARGARARRGPLRPAARPAHVPDPRRARPHHRLRRSRARATDQEPKYLNTPESPIFHKREAFYGLSAALEAIRRAERAVVVEGYFDRIALARAGVDEALATCGTALTEDHARNLRRRTRNVVLLFDGDEAGQRAMERSLEVLLPAGLRVRAALLPAGGDPDDLLAREGAEALRALVDRAPAGARLRDRPRGRARLRVARREGRRGRRASRRCSRRSRPASSAASFAQRLALAVGTEVRHVEAAVRAAEPRRGRARRGADPRAHEPGPKTARSGSSRAAWSIIPSSRGRVSRDEMHELVPRGPAARADRGAARRRPRRTARCRSKSSRGGSARTKRACCAQLAVADDALEASAAERTIDDTIRWLRKRTPARERLRALTQQLRDPDADVQAILEEKDRLTKQRLAATHHRVAAHAIEESPSERPMLEESIPARSCARSAARPTAAATAEQLRELPAIQKLRRGRPATRRT